MTEMTSSWLPTWAGQAWAVAFVVIALVHVLHLWAMRGPVRWWHATHVLMALGMAAMSWPSPVLVSAGVGEVFYAFLALSALVVLVVAGSVVAGTRRWPLVWLVAAADLAIMALMFSLPAASQLGALAVGAGALWLLVEAAGWATGTLVGAARRDLGVCLLEAALPLGSPVAERLREHPEPAEGESASPPTTPARPSAPSVGVPSAVGVLSAVRVTHIPQRVRRSHALSLRLTLTVMALGMVYLLLAMQFAASHHSGSMPGM